MGLRTPDVRAHPSHTVAPQWAVPLSSFRCLQNLNGTGLLVGWGGGSPSRRGPTHQTSSLSWNVQGHMGVGRGGGREKKLSACINNGAGGSSWGCLEPEHSNIMKSRAPCPYVSHARASGDSKCRSRSTEVEEGAQRILPGQLRQTSQFLNLTPRRFFSKLIL